VKKDEQIQLNKRELEMIFNASTDYVAVLDKDHKIKRVNLSFCALLGITPDEAMGVDFYTYFDDLPADFDKSQIKREDFVETTYLSRRFNKWFILRSRMLKQECDPLVYIHITKDVTRDFQ
jgi:PAS domain S-box-containing protein